MRASRQPCQRGRSAYGSTCWRGIDDVPSDPIGAPNGGSGAPTARVAEYPRRSQCSGLKPRRAPAPHHDLHRIALRVRDPGRAKRAEEVMRRAQHADALPAEICERRIHIVASHDDLGPWRAGAGGRACGGPGALWPVKRAVDRHPAEHDRRAGKAAVCAWVPNEAGCGWQRGEPCFWLTGREAGRYSGTIVNRPGLAGAVHRAAFAANGAAKSVAGRARAAGRDPRSLRCRLRWLGACP